MDAASPWRFDRVARDGQVTAVDRPIAAEHPIAFEFNGIGYAVMMASPCDLIDFATGFALSERLIEQAGAIADIEVHAAAGGVLVRATLAADRVPLLYERVRHRTTDSSCGLCGIDNLDHALRPLPRVVAKSRADDAAIFRALGDLADRQPLNRATGAVHAAAACSARGEVLEVREDVGRHNAFDKLIGALARAGRDWDGGFALLSSRCSYELVEKAVLAGCPMLVTISAATGLALRRATDCGLTLVTLARGDAVLRRPVPAAP